MGALLAAACTPARHGAGSDSSAKTGCKRDRDCAAAEVCTSDGRCADRCLEDGGCADAECAACAAGDGAERDPSARGQEADARSSSDAPEANAVTLGATDEPVREARVTVTHLRANDVVLEAATDARGDIRAAADSVAALEPSALYVVVVSAGRFVAADLADMTSSRVFHLAAAGRHLLAGDLSMTFLGEIIYSYLTRQLAVPGSSLLENDAPSPKRVQAYLDDLAATLLNDDVNGDGHIDYDDVLLFRLADAGALAFNPDVLQVALTVHGRATTLQATLDAGDHAGLEEALDVLFGAPASDGIPSLDATPAGDDARDGGSADNSGGSAGGANEGGANEGGADPSPGCRPTFDYANCAGDSSEELTVAANALGTSVGVTHIFAAADPETTRCVTSPEPGTVCMYGVAADASDATYSQWGALLGLQMSAGDTPWNASALGITGIMFDVESPCLNDQGKFTRPVWIQVSTEGDGTYDLPANPFVRGGNAPRPLTTPETGVVVEFSEFKQPGWNFDIPTNLPFDTSQIISLLFQANNAIERSDNYAFCLSNMHWIDAAGEPVPVTPLTPTTN